ncbi:ABC transporter ATP-binding protein [Salinisphaera hydrothermalis]|uniref:ABC transporter ATP-binding protein n=1 Tax=Salinisphaera hydrothermalis (strain C41B8) TaxID=1304275 RepID=A0A084IMI4_SALHC|nr:ABC transporter ATP-binding protein [Salinisphaera hydrothermalis]KEZ77918.1 ABC transporter ATP-binding protein [Salinisphaera hydrothermalis C41B8]
MAEPVIEIRGLSKTYESGFKALENVDLDIKRGEIFALLGPNGAGKTTLINILCGIVNPTGGSARAGGFDVIREFRAAREKIGLVPQELTVEPFTKVWSTVAFSRGLFGKPKNNAHIERVLKDLSLWDKRKNATRELSGGMKRRVMIAKALSHEPEILFLDEPTAGVDVELRRSMWNVVRGLREHGVTIVLTTHYLEEAEQMADRIGVIQNGEIRLVDETAALMTQLGEKRLAVVLAEPLERVPDALADYDLRLAEEGRRLVYTYNAATGTTGVKQLFHDLDAAGVAFVDVDTEQSSLEEIFVNLVGADR